MTQGIIRKATVADLDFVFDCVKRFYAESPWETKTTSDEKMRSAIENNLLNGTFFYYLITKDEKPVGIIQVMESDNSVEINVIYILPEFRSQGIGGAVMDELLSQWKEKGITLVKTEINLENKGSQQFFGTKGFLPNSINYEKKL